MSLQLSVRASERGVIEIREEQMIAMQRMSACVRQTVHKAPCLNVTQLIL